MTTIIIGMCTAIDKRRGMGKYKTHLEFSQYRPWVRDHIYVYNSDSSLPQSYMNQGSATNPNKNKFDGYYESVKEYLDSRFGTDEEIEKALKSSDKEVREAAQKAKNEKANYKETPSNCCPLYTWNT